MNQTTNPKTGEIIKYNRIGGTADNPIYFNDPVPTQTQPLNQAAPTTPVAMTSLTPTSPIKVPTVPTNNLAGEQMSQNAASVVTAQTAAQEFEQAQKASGTAGEDARLKLMEEALGLTNDKSTIQAGQATLEEQMGIREQEKALNDVSKQRAELQVQYRAEQDRIRNTPMSIGQKTIENNNLLDTYGRRDADLAILESAASGNVDRIQKSAERKTALLLQPIENKLKFFETFGKDNVDALTAKDKEKLSFIQQSLKDEKVRVQDLEKTKGQIIAEIAQNGGGTDMAVINAVQNAKDPVAAYTAGSKYIGALDRKLKVAQINKINADAAESRAKAREADGVILTETQLKAVDNSPQGKNLAALAKLKPLQDKYKALVELYGFSAVGDEKAAVDRAYADFKIAYKEAANLGALTGPDVGIIEEAVKPASGGVINYASYITSGGQSGIMKSIEQANKTAKVDALKNYKNLTLRNPVYGSSEYVKSFIDPFAVDITSFKDTEIKAIPKGEIIRTPEGVYLESLGEGKFTQI